MVMTMAGRRTVAGLALCLVASAVSAPAQSRSDAAPNAALRYWMAFAEIQDVPSDEATTRLLGEVESGQAAWEEARLGPIVQANRRALEMMRRASALARCDWGLEVELGPFTPIAHLARARVLARLNTLAGLRLTAAGRMDDAVDAWLAGVRFSQHVASGGSLISVLTARVALRSAMQAMTRVTELGQLNGAQRGRIRMAVAGIPETGFAWDAAIRAEQAALDVWVQLLAASPDFATAYQRMSGAAPSPGLSLPPAPAVAGFRRFMSSVAEAFRPTPERTRVALPGLDAARQDLHPFYQSLIPSLSRVNDTRAEVKAERDRLLAALASANE
jgi:hypothetical protein